MTTPDRSVTAVEPSALGRRLLVVAPHPDDEVLVAGGTIHALARAGASVRVVLLTAGDGYPRAARRLGRFRPDAAAYRRLGGLRFAESVRAAETLGLAIEDVACLGQPDGSLASMLAGGADRPAGGRTGDASVPYAFALRPGSPRTAHALVEALASEIAAFAPDTVIRPDARETHPDHAAASAFADEALVRAAFAGAVLGSFVHRGHYPFPWAHRLTARMEPPRSAPAGPWTSVELAGADVAAKEAALEAFATQVAVPDLRYFMRAFVRANELFASR